MTTEADVVPTPMAVSSDEEALVEAAAELDAVEAALARLEDRNFDRCDVCGRPVGRDRLSQDPLFTRCSEHS